MPNRSQFQIRQNALPGVAPADQAFDRQAGEAGRRLQFVRPRGDRPREQPGAIRECVVGCIRTVFRDSLYDRADILVSDICNLFAPEGFLPPA